ncbi:hypothetical protein [Myroides pelagicus]|uniref:Uncharacterized protein n=1 Tax=Myroides pelagicus TaxID=270914 RepID=A0A7K1GNI2_9FLAO|nr:hypothetical protein [Myroides pelagicus]MEC4115168.1 hypothetical protein [Myroides pelagicus]MTH30437.1 hypothetical protein [Myroides pelagicus]
MSACNRRIENINSKTVQTVNTPSMTLDTKKALDTLQLKNKSFTPQETYFLEYLRTKYDQCN